VIGVLLLLVCGTNYWAQGQWYVVWAVLAVVVLAVSLLMPRLLSRLKHLWLKLGGALHLVVSPVILGLVYVLAIIPVGVLTRLFFQLSGPCDVSYAEAGRHLARKLGADPGLVETVNASSAGVPEGATPRHTTLDSTLMRDRYGVAVPDVWDVIESLFSPPAALRRRTIASRDKRVVSARTR